MRLDSPINYLESEGAEALKRDLHLLKPRLIGIIPKFYEELVSALIAEVSIVGSRSGSFGANEGIIVKDRSNADCIKLNLSGIIKISREDISGLRKIFPIMEADTYMFTGMMLDNLARIAGVKNEFVYKRLVSELDEEFQESRDFNEIYQEICRGTVFNSWQLLFIAILTFEIYYTGAKEQAVLVKSSFDKMEFQELLRVNSDLKTIHEEEYSGLITNKVSSIMQKLSTNAQLLIKERVCTVMVKIGLNEIEYGQAIISNLLNLNTPQDYFLENLSRMHNAVDKIVLKLFWTELNSILVIDNEELSISGMNQVKDFYTFSEMIRNVTGVIGDSFKSWREGE